MASAGNRSPLPDLPPPHMASQLPPISRLPASTNAYASDFPLGLRAERHLCPEPLTPPCSASEVVLAPLDTWNNATFSANICALDLSTATFITVLASPGGAHFVLPDCVYNSGELTLVGLNATNLILQSPTTVGQRADPLSRLPMALETLILSNTVLLDPATNAPITSVIWLFFFNTHSSISQLVLQANQLRGPLPTSLPTQLAQIDLSNNQFSGSIPAQLLSNLAQDLDYEIIFANNALSGSLPSTLMSAVASTFPESISLDFSSNALTGAIPANLFSNTVFTSEDAVQVSLNVAFNQLTGNIPSLLFDSSSSLWSSVVLNFSSNRLTGNLPTTVISLTNTTGVGNVIFDVSSNQLTGSVTRNLARFDNYTHVENLIFDISKNKISGSLPFALTYDFIDGVEIDYLLWNLQANTITGTLPGSLFGTSIVHAWDLRLQSNAITGTLPNNFFNESLQTKDIRISFASNQLSGTVPSDFFEGMITRVGALTLDFSSNRLSGSIPDDFLLPLTFNVPQPDRYIDITFAHNQLTGPLPLNMVGPSVWSVKLNFDSNSMSGEYDFAGLCANASRYYLAGLVLSASGNQLSGAIEIPQVPINFPLILNMSYNVFTHFSADENAFYPRGLDISYNPNLQGSLPQSFFSSATYLVLLKAANTALTGNFPVISAGELPAQLVVLDLSYTSIQFCAANVTLWASSTLKTCLLRGVIATQECQDLYPVQCVFAAAPRALANSPRSASSRVDPSSATFVFMFLAMILVYLYN